MAQLVGKVALVAGATRGTGRGIATELGAAGATVYCTGRSVTGHPSDMARPETIDETAELVTRAGGRGIAVRTDHTQEADVKALFERVGAEQDGKLDVLVNDIWGGEAFVTWGRPFWEQDMAAAAKLIERAVFSHMLTSRYGVPLMLDRGRGLVVEITDGNTLSYRGNFLYDFVKTAVMRLAYGQAEDLRNARSDADGDGHPRSITALALTPGFLRSEEMLERFGVTEANWRDGADVDPYFIASETPRYTGRAVVALACDPNVVTKSGQAFYTGKLAREYGFTDQDGTQPDFQAFFASMERRAKTP